MKITRNFASANEIVSHLQNTEKEFLENLISRNQLEFYSTKLYEKAERIEIWHKNELVGLLAYYENRAFQTIFITNLSVIAKMERKGFGSILLKRLLDRYRELNTCMNKWTISLEVHQSNEKALNFYSHKKFVKNGFVDQNKNSYSKMSYFEKAECDDFE